MDKKIIIFGILMMFVGSLIVTSLSMTQETREQYVDCFDKYGSVINDLECTETQYSFYGIGYEYEEFYVPILMLMLICIFGGFVICLCGTLVPIIDAYHAKDNKVEEGVI